MGMEIIEHVGGLFTVKVSGKLKKSELEKAQKAAISAIRGGHKVRVLVTAENFLGWDDEGDWGDISFQLNYDEQIEKIAAVGKEEWEDLVTVFLGKGLRPVEIKYFKPDQLAIAKAWIGCP